MADELANRAEVARFLLDASIALDDLASRLSSSREGRQELSAEIQIWSRRLADCSEKAMDRMLK